MADDERRQDLAKLRALKVQRAPNLQGQRPGIFADAATMGLQRPVAGAAAALDFWNHPGTTMGERYQGGADAYTEGLDKEIEEAGAWALPQSLAGGLVMGGPSGSLWKQGAFDAATGGTQSLASGESWGDAAKNALFNAGFGGVLNSLGLGKGKLDERDRLVQEMLQLYQGGGR